MFVNMYLVANSILCSLRFDTKVNQCNIGTARKAIKWRKLMHATGELSSFHPPVFHVIIIMFFNYIFFDPHKNSVPLFCPYVRTNHHLSSFKHAVALQFKKILLQLTPCFSLFLLSLSFCHYFVSHPPQPLQ